MKNLTKIGVLIFGMCVFYACSEDKNTDSEEESISLPNTEQINSSEMSQGAFPEQEAFSEDVFETNVIGVLDDDGNFYRATENEMINYLTEIFGLDSQSITFGEFTITQVTNEEGEEFWNLKVGSNNGNLKFSVQLSLEQENFILAAKTCKCETTGCSWSGCDAQVSGNNCYCTSCSKDCKKTSTVTTSLVPYFRSV